MREEVQGRLREDSSGHTCFLPTEYLGHNQGQCAAQRDNSKRREMDGQSDGDMDNYRIKQRQQDVNCRIITVGIWVLTGQFNVFTYLKYFMIKYWGK